MFLKLFFSCCWWNYVQRNFQISRLKSKLLPLFYIFFFSFPFPPIFPFFPHHYCFLFSLSILLSSVTFLSIFPSSISLSFYSSSFCLLPFFFLVLSFLFCLPFSFFPIFSLFSCCCFFAFLSSIFFFYSSLLTFRFSFSSFYLFFLPTFFLFLLSQFFSFLFFLPCSFLFSTVCLFLSFSFLYIPFFPFPLFLSLINFVCARVLNSEILVQKVLRQQRR